MVSYKMCTQCFVFQYCQVLKCNEIKKRGVHWALLLCLLSSESLFTWPNVNHLTLYIFMCTQTHTCIHIHTYIHTYTHTYMHTHTHIHAYTYTHIHTHKYTHIHTHIYIHIYTYTYTCIYTCIYTYTCT